MSSSSSFPLQVTFTVATDCLVTPRCYKPFSWIYSPYGAVIQEVTSEGVRNHHFRLKLASKFQRPIGSSSTSEVLQGPSNIIIVLKCIAGQNEDRIWFYFSRISLIKKLIWSKGMTASTVKSVKGKCFTGLSKRVENAYIRFKHLEIGKPNY